MTDQDDISRRNQESADRDKRVYLGDGLYAHHDGYQVILSTERQHGQHYVGLEPSVLSSFFSFLEWHYNGKITFVKNEDEVSG